MDQREIIKEKFHPIFRELNLHQRKYAEVWLSFANFGRVYFTDELYELKVKLLPGIECKFSDITEIMAILDQKAKQEFRPVIFVDVIGAEEYKRCKKKDVMVYCDGE